MKENEFLIVTLEGEGSVGPPSTFDTVHPIDIQFGTYNELLSVKQSHVVFNWSPWQP